MGFWYVGAVGNNSRMDSPRVSRDLVLQNLKNMNVLLISSILQGSPSKVECLGTRSYTIFFRDHSHQNRIEKLVRLNQVSTLFSKNI